MRPDTIEHRASIYADALALLEAEYASHLTIEHVARRVASSRRQVQRAFAEIGGTTFRASLIGVRMTRAAELLEAERLPIRDVAWCVGYRQPAEFAKSFRRHHGVSPSQYRAGVPPAALAGRRVTGWKPNPGVTSGHRRVTVAAVCPPTPSCPNAAPRSCWPRGA